MSMPIAAVHPAAAFALLDLAGLSVFAASGALAAAARRQTLVTFAFFAAMTGTGGGTLRDLLIGAPVFWMQDARAIGVCLAVAVLVWCTPERIWSPKALDWFDAVGLAAYAVYGAAKALDHAVPPLPAIVMGVVTACMGGVIRDVLAGEPSIILRPELYVTAAALASALFVLLSLAGLPFWGCGNAGGGGRLRPARGGDRPRLGAAGLSPLKPADRQGRRSRAPVGAGGGGADRARASAACRGRSLPRHRTR